MYIPSCKCGEVALQVLLIKGVTEVAWLQVEMAIWSKMLGCGFRDHVSLHYVCVCMATIVKVKLTYLSTMLGPTVNVFQVIEWAFARDVYGCNNHV